MDLRMSGAVQLLKKGVVSLGATLGSATAYGSAIGSGVFTVTSNNVLCTASGGTPPYTYQWAYVSGVTNMYISTPTSASTSFYTTGSPVFSRVAVFKCTVTDAVSGVVIATPNVTVTLDYDSNL